jgi:hypothetical protein
MFLQNKVFSFSPNRNLDDQVSAFMSHSDRVAHLNPQTPDSLFVAFYDSQGYGGGFLTRLHTGMLLLIRYYYLDQVQEWEIGADIVKMRNIC